MTELAEGTASEGTATPVEGATAPAAAAATTPDELTTLKSRNSGLNSKVTELSDQLKAEKTARELAEAAVRDSTKGDEALRKQLADALELNAKQAKAVELANMKTTYPEAAELLGEGIVGMAPEVLAAMETRLKGVVAGGEAGAVETPVPVGNNAQRTTGPKSIEDMTSAELQAEIKKLPREAFGITS